jgi:uncharacterized protein YraI
MIAAGLLALSGGAASANPAVVAQDLHLRAGPGANYAVVSVMPQGADVQAWNCDGGWCRVSYNGETGFASRRYLDVGYARMTRPANRAYAYAPRPAYRTYAYAAPLPNPLDFPLLPWNWGRQYYYPY